MRLVVDVEDHIRLAAEEEDQAAGVEVHMSLVVGVVHKFGQIVPIAQYDSRLMAELKAAAVRQIAVHCMSAIDAVFDLHPVVPGLFQNYQKKVAAAAAAAVAVLTISALHQPAAVSAQE